MEIGFENVMLSDETRKVAAHISGYIKLVKKFEHCCKTYCIKESKTALKTHVYIDLYSLSSNILSLIKGSFVSSFFNRRSFVWRF